MDKKKELELFYKQAAEVNRRLKKFGEYIPLEEPLFKAFLAGVLDRLLYDEKKISPGEAQEIEGLMEGILDPFALELMEKGIEFTEADLTGRPKN